MYLTIPELARRVGVHRSTVYRWVRSGRLKPEAVVTRRSIFLLAPSAVAEAQRIRRRNAWRKKSAIK